MRYESNVTSKDTFYTDSNGREMIKRVRNERPTWDLDVTEPVSGNYYPLTAGIFLKVAFLTKCTALLMGHCVRRPVTAGAYSSTVRITP